MQGPCSLLWFSPCQVVKISLTMHQPHLSELSPPRMTCVVCTIKCNTSIKSHKNKRDPETVQVWDCTNEKNLHKTLWEHGRNTHKKKNITISNNHFLCTLGSENMEGIHTRKRTEQYHTYLKSLLKFLLRVDASRNHFSKIVLSQEINTHFPSFVFLAACHSVQLHFTNYTDGQSIN